MSQPMNAPMGATQTALKLEYPMSVAVYDTYADAQKAVDFLADKQFPVENLAIVGTDLRQYERVMGRKSWGSVLVQGAVSGIGTGILIALMMYFLQLTFSLAGALVYGLILGVVMGIIMAALGHWASRGARDFNSITQTFANSYEVLAEHKVAAQARELVAQLPTGKVVGLGAPVPEPATAPVASDAVQPTQPEPPAASSAVQATSQGWYPTSQPQDLPQGNEQPTFDPRPPAERS